MKIEEAVREHNNAVTRSVRVSESFGPVEADAQVNRTACDVIKAVFENHGIAVLVSLNYAPTGEEKVRVWDGCSVIYNFDADAVLPVDDPEVRRLIAERDAAKYTGTRADGERIDAIHQRIKEVGGHLLVWA